MPERKEAEVGSEGGAAQRKGQGGQKVVQGEENRWQSVREGDVAGQTERRAEGRGQVSGLMAAGRQ